MPNDQKINVVKETTEKLKKSSGVYFTRYTGIDVQTITKLRKSFRDNDVDYSVTKNTLTKIAAKEAGYESIIDNLLSGQVAIAYSEDPVMPAKIIKEFKKENEELIDVLGLIFDGELYPAEKYKDFASLPSKDELLATLSTILKEPTTKFVIALNDPFAKLLSSLNNLKNTKS
jgi:large subunit ribosomal protein L10